MRTGETLVLYTDGRADRAAAAVSDEELRSLLLQSEHPQLQAVLDGLVGRVDALHGRRAGIALLALRPG